jgi:WD40 repeat protein
MQDTWILSIDFNADGSILAAATRASYVTLWDVSTGLMLGVPLSGHRDLVNSIAFTRDGQTLVSGGGDRVILEWDVDLMSWQQRACRIANRTLTPEEWGRYLETEPYETICPISE